MAEIKATGGLIAWVTQEGARLRFPQDDLGPYPLRAIETSQCQVACPLGTDVKGYVGLIAAGKFQQALELIRETNPFPAICGRVCLHPCEPECRRGEVDSPVAIRALKRFVADVQLSQPVQQARPMVWSGRPDERVAVVGSGPAGLTAASDLARWRFGVTVFEALPVAGGMLSVGIAPFRLPRAIIAAEIAAIAASGVQIRTSRFIRDPRRLLKRGFAAIFLAIGAHRGLKLGIPGEDLRGCVDALSFLRQQHLGKRIRPGRRAVVIGAGHAALDAARTALRLGWRQVDLVYRRSRDELPYPILAAQAEREGVGIRVHLEPVKIQGRGGRATAVVCAQTRSGPADGVGRREPLLTKGKRVILEADLVICGVHQEPDLSFLPTGHGFDISAMNTLVVDPQTLATSHQGIFAGGDAVSGPKSVIEAIAMGHQAAASIHRFLRGRDVAREDWVGASGQWQVCIDDYVPQPKRRLSSSRISPRSWKGHFQEVMQSPSGEQAVAEARRCLMCGPCGECQQCQAHCQQKLLALALPETPGEDVLVRMPWIPQRFPPGDGPWEVILDSSAGSSLRAMAWPMVCHVREQFCRGCARCLEVCPYEARQMVSRGPEVVVCQVDLSICRGCGACVTVCPTGASQMSRLSGHDIAAALDRSLGPEAGRPGRRAARPRIVVLACRWSASAHLMDGLSLPAADVSLLQIMCLGNINSGLILRAFELGADGVLLLGCQTQRCHYGGGAEMAGRELLLARQLMETLGIEGRRVKMETVCQPNGKQMRGLLQRFVRMVVRLRANPVRI